MSALLSFPGHVHGRGTCFYALGHPPTIQPNLRDALTGSVNKGLFFSPSLDNKRWVAYLQPCNTTLQS